MQVTQMFRGESLTRLLQGIALGAAATMIVGFSWGGWVRGSTAEDLAQTRANSAVVAALAPICVEQFQQGADAPAKLAEFKKANSWDQSTYIEKGGWSVMPGNKGPNVSGVSQACATALRDLK
jgi:hypothetical protein